MKLLDISKRLLCALTGAAITVGLLAFWIVTSRPAQAGGDDLLINQRNAADTGTLQRVVAHPPGSPSVLFYDQSTLLPILIPLGSSFVVNSGTLDVSSPAPSWASITSKPTTLSGFGITDAYPLSGNPSGFLTAAVTSITAGTGLGGGTITSTGTISMPNTGTAGTYSGVTTDAQGRVTAGTVLSINDSPGRSLVTTTSSTGYQISSTRNARACYEGQFSTTSTIGGNSAVSVFLETADTNSTTPSDWTTKSQQTYSNNITLAVALNQVQSSNWSMCRDIPAGKFVRIRSGSITGTASASINSQQQETLQ